MLIQTRKMRKLGKKTLITLEFLSFQRLFQGKCQWRLVKNEASIMHNIFESMQYAMRHALNTLDVLRAILGSSTSHWTW